MTFKVYYRALVILLLPCVEGGDDEGEGDDGGLKPRGGKRIDETSHV